MADEGVGVIWVKIPWWRRRWPFRRFMARFSPGESVHYEKYIIRQLTPSVRLTLEEVEMKRDG